MRPLRIGYSCHDAFPSTDTNTQQIFWTLTEVARLGCVVDLVVPAVVDGGDARSTIARHYGAPDGRLPDTFSLVPVGRTAPMSNAARGWFDWNVAGHLARRQIDLVWTRDAIAALSSVRAGLPTVFETYRPDLASSMAFAPWRSACLHGRTFLGVINHSRLAQDAFLHAGVPADRAILAHNGYAPSLMEPVLERHEARARCRLPDDRPLVVYTGHVGPKKGVDALIDLASRVPEARFVIVGVDEASAERTWIEERARAQKAGNLLLIPRVPLTAVAAYLYAADCLVVPPTDEPLRRYRRTVLPMKLFSYLAAGRAIVAPDLPDVGEILTDGKNARLVSATDRDAAAAALRSLLSDGALQDRLSTAARETARHLTWAARAERIVAFLEARPLLVSARAASAISRA